MSRKKENEVGKEFLGKRRENPLSNPFTIGFIAFAFFPALIRKRDAFVDVLQG